VQQSLQGQLESVSHMAILRARGTAVLILAIKVAGISWERKGKKKIKIRNEPQLDNQAEGPLHAPRKRAQCSHLLSLEPDNRVIKQVSEIQFPPLLYDIPVLPHKQPANVGEEEAAAGVVWVRICLRVLVVHTVVSAPLIDVVLHRKHGDKGWALLQQYHLQLLPHTVTPTSPSPMLLKKGYRPKTS